MYPRLILKTDRIASVAFRHPWVFSGAFISIPKEIPHGSLVYVTDSNGTILGTGTHSKTSSISVRVLDFKETVIDELWMTNKIREADEKRKFLGYPNQETTGYRVVFGESDGLPGLVVDRYENILVIQISTAGMANLKEFVVKALKTIFKPKTIVERSDLGVRHEEDLAEEAALVHGKSTEAAFLEHGYSFIAEVLEGQKTGFYLDQKELRNEIEKLASGKTVLNMFSYTGAAAVYALKGGAKHVTCVDSSEPALKGCERHLELNKIPLKQLKTEVSDAFQWLDANTEASYDMVILDPPALIKSKKDLESGKKAYHFLNRAAMRLLKEGGIFVTSSCSHFMSEEDMTFLLRRASIQAGVKLELIKSVRQSPDHPESIYFPESRYLKSFIGIVHKL